MAEIVMWPGITRLDLPAEQVLSRAIEADLDGVIIVGFTKDGGEFFASSHADAGTVMYHLRRGEHALMKIIDSMTE